MNKDSELKTRITAFLVLLVALLVVFAGFLGFFRDYGNIFRQGEEKDGSWCASTAIPLDGRS